MRTRTIHPSVAILAVAAFAFSAVPSLLAQSGSRTYRQPAPSPQRYAAPPRGSGSRAPAQGSERRAPAQGSGNRAPAAGSGSRMAGKPALSGFCPVCIIEKKQWVRGDQRYSVNYDGQQYLFPGEMQMKVFQANPVKYIPVLGGNCPVCQVEMGEAGPGSVYHAAFYRDRLYLFPDADHKAKFKTNPDKYAGADLAHGGNCAVCLVEGNQRMPGKPEFAVLHRNKRYLFPSAEMRTMFLKSPEKYAER